MSYLKANLSQPFNIIVVHSADDVGIVESQVVFADDTDD